VGQFQLPSNWSSRRGGETGEKYLPELEHGSRSANKSNSRKRLRAERTK
jgi:hypothetical protein